MPLKTGRRLLAALVTSVAVLAGAPVAGAAPNLELEIAAPKGAGALLDELTVTATCTEACTMGLQALNVLRYDRAKQQQPGAATQDLKNTKNLKAGQKGVFRIALAPQVRTHIQTALIEKQIAVVQVVPTLDGAEWGYRTATIRTAAGPKIPGLGQDEIVVPEKVKTKGPGTRYRVSVEGVQTTTWRMDYRGVDESGCTTYTRGEGVQTIKFRTPRAQVMYFDLVASGAAALFGRDGWLEYQYLDFDITRDGKLDSGASGEGCDDGGGGHCPECDPGQQPECTKTGKREGFLALLLVDRKGRLHARSGAANKTQFYNKPDCPIEPFKDALGDVDLLGAVHKLGDPRKHGGGGKVIVVLRKTRTDPLYEGAGSTTTTVRWTVTFKRLG